MARPSDLPFDLLTTLFRRVQGARGRDAKARHLALFRHTVLANNCEDNYAVYRLLLPAVGPAPPTLLHQCPSSAQLAQAGLFSFLCDAQRGRSRSDLHEGCWRSWTRTGNTR